MDDVQGIAVWALLFTALYWRPAKTTLRDRLMAWLPPRTDP